MGFRRQCGFISAALVFASALVTTDCVSAAPRGKSKGERGVSTKSAPKSERQAARKSNAGTRAASSGAVGVATVGQGNEVSIVTSSAEPKYSITRLESPPRLVIDLESEKVKGASTIAAPNMEYVAGVRVGSHPTKSRIVVDLKNVDGLTHAARVEQGKIVVTLANSKVAKVAEGVPAKLPEPAKATLPLQAKKTEPLPTVTKASKPSALTLDEEVVTSGSNDTRAQTIGDIMTTKPVSTEKSTTGVQVKNVSLENVGGSSEAVVIGVTGEPQFSMARTAPSEYVLTLRNTGVEDQVMKRPVFSARKESGIRSVRTVVDGSNTMVRVFTQPSSYLTTRTVGDRLFIEETQDLAQVAKDIRAQLAPDAAKAAAAEPKADPKADPKAKAEAAVKEKSAEKEKQSEKADPKAVSEKEQAASKGSDVPQSNKSQAAIAPDESFAAFNPSDATYSGKLISLDLQDADIDSALRIIAEVSNLNIVATDGVTGKVTLKLVDVPWDQALDVILKSNGLDKVVEGNVMRVAPIDKLRQERAALKQARVAQEELEPIDVKYMRVSYAKAAEIKALVETVLSERGSVAFDERSNQLIVKDVKQGLDNVTELIKKIDLRTPQILLETQIVEASRNLARELGSELGFQYIQSPSTGNGTGLNFPAAISLGGSAVASAGGASLPGAVSAFPVSADSAITMLFDSADGTKNLALRLTQLETEGTVKIISKPAVATTNNKPAEIKSVEKFRVKLPSGGVSVATGAGAQSAGGGSVATETIEAGIVLNVTPQASPDYYILLDIKARSSSFGETRVDGIPNEIERSASSSVLVSSGQTFALGGIYKINENSSVAGMPFFKEIPVLGTFFRSSRTVNSDEELLFFITPRIIEGSFEDVNTKVNS